MTDESPQCGIEVDTHQREFGQRAEVSSVSFLLMTCRLIALLWPLLAASHRLDVTSLGAFDLNSYNKSVKTEQIRLSVNCIRVSSANGCKSCWGRAEVNHKLSYMLFSHLAKAKEIPQQRLWVINCASNSRHMVTHVANNINQLLHCEYEAPGL